MKQAHRYLGVLCPSGHDHEGTGQSLRTAAGCMACNREYQQRWRATHRDRAQRRPPPLPGPTEAQQLAAERSTRRRHSLPVCTSVVDRATCPEQRPCPRVQCRYHLGDLAGPSVDISETCALDLADRGGMTLQDVARHLGISRERVRQIEEVGLRKLARRGIDLRQYLLAEHGPAILPQGWSR